MPIAEVCRRVGARAADLGLAQPSYEQVRTLVHETRRWRRQPTAAGVFLDVVLRSRPPEALYDYGPGICTIRPRRAK